MLRVTVYDSLQTRVFTFTQDVVNIGRSLDNDIVLRTDMVSRRHARLIVDRAAGQVTLQDRQSTSGTFVGGKNLWTRGEGKVVGPADDIRIGNVKLNVLLEVLEPEIVAEREREWLEALRRNGSDDDTRAVYADWLEEHGSRDRAEFLREQMAIRKIASAEDPAFRASSERLRALAEKVGVGWRARVAMLFIEPSTCGLPRGLPVAMEMTCPKRWEEMTPTAIEGVRTCNACKMDVVYCTTIEQARQHAADGGCIAIDVRVARSKDDLSESAGRYSVRGRPAPSFATRGSPLRKPAENQGE